MNYGGPPDYGMMRQGQGAPGGPGQHPTQQQMQQQRMMMQGGGPVGPQMGRQMYAGMGPQQMQQQPGYAMTQQQQQQMAFQQQQVNINQVLSRLPVDIQQKIQQETDVNKKNAMIKHYCGLLQQHRQQQQQQHQQAAAAAAAAGRQMGQGMEGQMMQGPNGPMPGMMMRQPGAAGPGPSQGVYGGPTGGPSGQGGPGTQSGQHPMMSQQQQMQMQQQRMSSQSQPQHPQSVPVPSMSSVPSVGSTGPQSVHPLQSGPGSVSGPMSQSMAQPMSQQPAASPQVAALQAGHPVQGASPANMMGQSPATNNPRTPGQGGPHSVNTAPNSQGPASQEEQMTPDYADRLKKMKELHYEATKRIFERSKMDGIQPPKGLERLIEVMEEKRVVTLSLLEKLSSNVGTLCERQSLTYPLLDAIKQRTKKERSESGGESHTMDMHTNQPIICTTVVKDEGKGAGCARFPDPWAPVRHLMIRVPDHVRSLYKSPSSTFTPSSHSTDNGRKRASTEKAEEPVWNSREGKFEVENGETDVKRAKLESDFPSTSSPNVDPSTVPSPRGTTQGMAMDGSNRGAVIQQLYQSVPISCMFDQRVQWQLSADAYRELSGCKWKVESDHAPAGKRTPDVVLSIESDLLMCCPLRVLLPQSYPEDPAVVLFEQSFPSSAPLSSQLEALFRRRFNMQPDRSLRCIRDAWRDACEQQLRLQGGLTVSGTVPFLPNAQTKQLVA